MSSERWEDERGRTLVIIGLVGVVLLAWLLLVPQGAQPDEASHLVRSAALVRSADGDGDGVYVVPHRYQVAEPACYAFQPTQPVTCASVPEHTGGEVPLFTRADDYPPGAHAAFGVVTLLPGLDPVWWGRLLATGTSAVLLGWALALARRHSAILAAALLLGVTPMAWSIMTAVNPSAFATAGAVALWIGGLTVLGRHTGEPTDEEAGAWLLTAGWIAMTLARRDGLVWACLAVALMCLTFGRTPLDLARRLGALRLALLGVATLITLAWGITSSSSSSRWVVAAPAVLVAAELVVRWWPRIGRQERWAVTAGLALLAVVSWPLLVARRPGGWDTNLLLTVIAQTDDNLIEAIGILGWLDTPVPGVVVDAWLVALGALVAVAVITRSWLPAAVLAAVTVVTSWTFEMIQGNVSGMYWQGRYSLPLLVGLPLLLVLRVGRTADRLVLPVTVASLLFVNVAGWAAARRWGVGLVGSYLPWRWDTPLQPVPPLLLLLAMAAASVALAVVVVRPPADRR